MAEAPGSPTEADMPGPSSPTMEGPSSPTVDGPHSPTVDGPHSPTVDGPHSPTVDRPNSHTSEEVPTNETTGAEETESPAEPQPDDSDQEKTTPKKRRVVDTDSDDEGPTLDNYEEEKITPSKRRIVDSSDDEDGDDSGPSKRKRVTAVSDDEDEAEASGSKQQPTADNATQSDGEAASDKDQAVLDIFGDSSDEEGEFEGFDESEIKKTAAEEVIPGASSSDDELEDDSRRGGGDFVSDFDLMLAKKKEERSSNRRRRKNVDIISDNDDLIVEMLKNMKEAAEEDRTLNKNHQPATKKLTMLPYVIRQLNKAELQPSFMDCGVLSALTEWLAPQADKSLPHLQIRQALLKILSSFPHPHTDQLKSSGIGKAVMYLYKHPKEIRQNRDIAGRLINEWSRPIFGQSANFKTVSREDREKRDFEQIPKNRRKSSTDADRKEEEAQRALKPGDPGWIYRARVPNPSNKDYVVRPQSNIDEGFVPAKSSKKEINRYEKQKRKMAEKKKHSKQQRAVTISIEGRNMAL